MREAIANANVFNLVIVFVIVLLGFFVGSLSYSKAYKVKNMIVNEIEKNEGWDEDVQKKVEESLNNIGYRVMPSINVRADCENKESDGEVVSVNSKYEYCIFKFKKDRGSKETVYYRVIAYMYFDVPLINSMTKVPVVGETKGFTTLNS